MNSKEPLNVWKRLLGFFFGGIAGLVLGVIVFLILDAFGVIAGGDRLFIRFAVWGAGSCAVLGFAFPRPLIAIGYFLGQLIPGF